MGFTPSYRTEIEDRMRAVVPIESKPMFGGVGIYSEGLFFALIAEDRLYFKVADSNRHDFEALGMKPFCPFGNDKPMQYWELPPGVIEDPDELGVWIDKALAVAQAAKASKRVRPRT